MYQIAQWSLIIALPITTIVFLCAGIQAHRTHGGLSFDSMVLYLCAIYNVIFLVEDLIHCTAGGQLVKNLFVTCMILYLLYNFKQLLTDLEEDLEVIKKR